MKENSDSTSLWYLLFLLIPLVPAHLYWMYGKQDQIPSSVVIVLVAIFGALFIFLGKSYIDFKREEDNLAPKLKCKENDLWVFEKSNFFVYGGIVSFIDASGESERVIGFGIVDSFTTKGSIQVKSLYFVENQTEQKVLRNKKILLKPTVDWNIISEWHKVNNNGVQNGN